MPADEVPPSRAFVTAAQSLQHLETNARLANARQDTDAPQDAPTQVYQQAPQDHRIRPDGGHGARSADTPPASNDT